VTEILAAQEPAQPLAPITTFQRETVLIEWVAPNDLGSPITAYNIYIKKSDGTFSLELNDCDGTDTTIISDTACTVLVSTLINTPFSLAWGSDIYAEVVAINDYGRSLTSESGNGAKIIYYADKPVSLTETVSDRSATSITFSWAAGALVRGSAVFDYQIFRAVASVGTYTSIATGVTTLSYTAEGLVTGETYSFKVQA
jgi:cellulose 1,4-beta-cellobiosidase